MNGIQFIIFGTYSVVCGMPSLHVVDFSSGIGGAPALEC